MFRFVVRSFAVLSALLTLLVAVLCVNTALFTYGFYSPADNATTPKAATTLATATLDSAATLERLCGAVRIPTVSSERGGTNYIDTAAFEAMNAYLAANFPRCFATMQHETVGKYSHVFKWAGNATNEARNAKPVLLLAHLDVVPVEESSANRWTHPPFEATIADGYLWGRGTMDDKCAALGLLEAAENLIAQGFTPARTIYFCFGHNEEIGGNGGAKAIAELLSQRGVHAAWALDEGLVVVKGSFPGLTKPLALIGVTEKGYTTLHLETSLAQGGHSSMPPPVSAVGTLARALTQLDTHPFPATFTPAVEQLFDVAGRETTLPMRIVFANRWLFASILKSQLLAKPASAALLRTTTALTMLEGGTKENVLPTRATAAVNFRILPSETVESVRRRVVDIIGDTAVHILANSGHSIGSNPAPVADMHGEGFMAIAASVRRVFPEAVSAPGIVVAITDSRHYAPVAENLYRFLPLVFDGTDFARVHGIDERIAPTNYLSLVRFYTSLISTQ